MALFFLCATDSRLQKQFAKHRYPNQNLFHLRKLNRGDSTAICKFLIAFFSPPENPTFIGLCKSLLLHPDDFHFDERTPSSPFYRKPWWGWWKLESCMQNGRLVTPELHRVLIGPRKHLLPAHWVPDPAPVFTLKIDFNWTLPGHL